jgi:hypothetical protein
MSSSGVEFIPHNKFIELNDLPRAVLLIKDIKTSLTDLFLTGRIVDHNHKFDK